MKLYDESGNPAMVVKSASHDVASALEKVLKFYRVADRPAAELVDLSRAEFIKRMQGRSRREVLETCLSLHAALQTRTPTKVSAAGAELKTYNAMPAGAEKRTYLKEHGAKILAQAKAESRPCAPTPELDRYNAMEPGAEKREYLMANKTAIVAQAKAAQL